MNLRNTALALTVALVMVFSTAMVSLQASAGSVKYEYYVWGNPDDVTRETSPGLLLAGGGTDVAEAMIWMIEKSGGGDFLVIRAAGTDAYNPWIYKQLGVEVDSCETIIFLSDEASYDQFCIDKILCADALFIAGGDQYDYVSMWKGTPVEDAIHALAEKGVPIGGTSAGLAVLGEFSFTAEFDTIDSVKALSNPYHKKVAIENDFLELDNMEDKITDSHFVARDRMGRLVTFLARIVQDGWAEQARGIGIEEGTALAVEANGDVTLFSACLTTPGVAYFLTTPGMPEVCERNTPLTYLDIQVHRIHNGDSFNLVTWSGEGGTDYTLSAVDGVLTSSQEDGSIY